MNRLWIFLLDSRTLTVLGLAALAAFLFVGASTLELALVYVGIAIAAALLIWLIVWIVRRVRARRAGREFGQAIEQDAIKAPKEAPTQSKAEVEAVRARLLAAVKTIKTSKLGETTGAAALYELPWYIVIGNPAAGNKWQLESRLILRTKSSIANLPFTRRFILLLDPNLVAS